MCSLMFTICPDTVSLLYSVANKTYYYYYAATDTPVKLYLCGYTYISTYVTRI